MVKCDHCGRIWEENELDFIFTDEGNWSVCPKCRRESLTNVERCEHCGSYAEHIDEGLCDECAGKTLRVFQEILRTHFTEEQVNYLSRVDCF